MIGNLLYIGIFRFVGFLCRLGLVQYLKGQLPLDL